MQIQRVDGNKKGGRRGKNVIVDDYQSQGYGMDSEIDA